MALRSRLVAAAVLLVAAVAVMLGAVAAVHSWPLFVAVAVVLVLLTGGLGWKLLEAPLRPLTHLQVAAAAVVSHADIAHRVPERPAGGQLEELSRTYNAAMQKVAEMYAALEVIVVTQRRFVADASHELRTPLTTVGSSLEMLQRYPEMPEDRRDQVVVDALHEARRMGSLVDNLLMLARLDSGERLDRVSFEWADVLSPAISDARSTLAPRRLELEVEEKLGRGVGDPAALRQLLAILFSNATVHTPADTTVSLSVHRGSGDVVSLCLTDDGPGVPAARLTEITERFVQLDPARHGSSVGLGLSIAKAIAANHGGTIEAAAVLPHGLRITVTVPPMAVRQDRRRAPRPGRATVSATPPSAPPA